MSKDQATWLAVIIGGIAGMMLLFVGFCGFAVMFVGGHHWETPERRKQIHQQSVKDNEQLWKELSERRR